MLTKTKAIVLHTIKYGESQLIVHLLTEQHGRMAFIQHVSARGKGRGAGGKGLYQPATQLDIVFDHRPQMRLQRLREVRIAEPYTSIPFAADKLSIALFLTEVLYHCTREEPRNGALFQYVAASLRWLDGAVAHYANFHLVFMMRMARFVGFFPNLDDYHDGDCFDLRGATFCRRPPLHHDFLQPDEAARICTLMRMNYESMRLFRLSRTERNRIADLLVDYYRLHVASFPEPRSLAVVRELFV